MSSGVSFMAGRWGGSRGRSSIKPDTQCSQDAANDLNDAYGLVDAGARSALLAPEIG